MNKDQFNANFPQLRSAILERWNKLTDEDLRQINGRYELLISKIQEKYGISREIIEEQIRSFAPNVRFDRERDVVLSRKAEEEESSSVGKWLLAAGIPFLFLLGYLGTHYNTPVAHDNAYTPSSSNQTLYTKAPVDGNVDTALSQNIRKSLFADSVLANDLRDLRIESSNGVVTVYGVVKNESEKAQVTRIIESTSGVVKVNNKVDVKL